MKAGVIQYHDNDFVHDNEEGNRPKFPQYQITHDNYNKPIDIPLNKRNFIYSPCSPNPLFTQLGYCTTEYPFKQPGFNVMDRSLGISLAGNDNRTVSVVQSMGWRTSRCDVCIKEGTTYWEVEVVNGGSTLKDRDSVGEDDDDGRRQKDLIDSSAHLRFGVSRREANLEAPVGFDSYGYGIRDQAFESIFEGQLKNVLKVTKSDHLQKGDRIGFLLKLPNLDTQKEQAKEYTRRRMDALRNVTMPSTTQRNSSEEPFSLDNSSDTRPTKKKHKSGKSSNKQFELALLEDIDYDNIVRDSIAIRYRNQLFFEGTDYVKTTKPEYYSSDRRERQEYYTLEGSRLGIYLNGKFLGDSFVDLNPILPPFSELQYNEKFYYGYWKNGEYIGDQNLENKVSEDKKEHRDNETTKRTTSSRRKGLILRNKYVNNSKLGYYPTVSCFNGGEATIITDRDKLKYFDKILQDVQSSLEEKRAEKIKTLDILFIEQVADDIVWDIIDEVEEEINYKKSS